MRLIVLAVSALLTSLTAGPATAQQAIAGYRSVHHPVYSETGMVASQSAIASQVGARIMEDGGNAVDAAVATAFALAVTVPRAGNIGGGGFMLVYDADSQTTTAIDYREKAPFDATRDMFLDAAGEADPQLSRYSHRSSGVPGTVAGLYLAHQKFGSLSWESVVRPAEELARNGIEVSRDLSERLKQYQGRLCRFAAACGYFYKPGGVPYETGELLVQSDLAETFHRIAEDGPDAFYRGPIAELIVEEMDRGHGLIDMASLAAYRPMQREALRGNYRGYEIVTMPPPSSGGVHLLQMLNILEHFPLSEMGAGSADEVHVLAEVMRLAYADRSQHLGDPDFYPVPVDWLTGKEYAAELADTVDMEHARPSADVAPGVAPPYESPETTHFSVMDGEGNVVSNTYTLNLSFGSGIAVAGAGFLLNDEMDDFVSKPGVPNAFGLLGDEANAVEAGKRPLSSMTPTIVFDHGKPWLATGSPGGPRIISTVLQMIVDVIDHGMNIADAVDQPRMHHQWYPDLLVVERGYGPDTIRLLRERGHDVRVVESINTTLQAVAVRDGLFRGASDPRRPGAASVAPEPRHGRGD